MADHSDKRRTDRIFAQALELPDTEREAFLRARCGEDADQLLRVRRLLKAAEGPEPDLDEEVHSARESLFRAMADDHEQEDLSGRQIDHWRLVEPIGRGGLSTVYRAQRSDGHFDQLAAFKVLRRGLDTDDLIGRFRRERQILSTLDHPAIVQILDGGALADGRPYLVLDFVRGDTITDHCRNRDLSLRDRLRLVIRVLDALQHAHRHLVIHRDIKPSNILVTEEGNVALLDFGIAKLLDNSLVVGHSPATLTGAVPLTPGYASPEQRAGRAVTTASDLYQVGVLLYELLTGQRPDTSGSGQVAAASRLNRRWKSMLAGDLDAIVATAMHHLPERRYASASEMAADLERYLDGQPVNARPYSLPYRISRQLVRRPWLAPLLLAVSAVLAAYGVTVSRYNRDLSQAQARTAAVQDFIVGLFESADPYAPADPDLGQRITVLEAIDLGRARLDRELTDQPETRAALLVAMSRIYQSLGQHQQAITLREEALELQQGQQGISPEAVISSQRFLAVEYAEDRRFEAAKEMYRAQLDGARSLFPERSPQVGVAEAAMARWLWSRGDGDGSRQLLKSAIGKLRDQPREFADDLVHAVVLLTTRHAGERSPESLPLLLDTFEFARRTFGEESMHTAVVQAQLAATFTDAGDYDQAMHHYRDAIALHEKHLGPDHNATLSAMNNLGVTLLRMERYEESETLYRRSLEQLTDLRGEQDPSLAGAYQNLATALSRQGRYEAAMPLHQRAYELYQKRYPDGHLRTALPQISQAYAHLRLDQPEYALPLARHARATLTRFMPDSAAEAIAKCLQARAGEALGEPQPELLAEAGERLRGEGRLGPYSQFCGVLVN